MRHSKSFEVYFCISEMLKSGDCQVYTCSSKELPLKFRQYIVVLIKVIKINQCDDHNIMINCKLKLLVPVCYKVSVVKVHSLIVGG